MNKRSRIWFPVAGAGVGLAAAAWAVRRNTGFNFRDRVVVITGGSRGLGLVLARDLAAQGARVALVARDAEELNRAVEDLKSRGAEALALPCDLRDQQQAQQAIQKAIDHFGRLDVLINNAGIIRVGPIEHMTLDDFSDSMAVHLFGPLYTIAAALPQMRQQGGGRIVNISSIGGALAMPHLAPYTAGKFALSGLSEALRVELAKDNILVTTVLPGLMRTGSPPNAMFKGRNHEEYAWFALFDALPIASTDARSAARRILAACRRGQPQLVINLSARLAIAMHALFPNITARAMALVNRLLPRPSGREGDEAHSGWESQSRWAPSALTRLSDKATEANNEQRIRVPVT